MQFPGLSRRTLWRVLTLLTLLATVFGLAAPAMTPALAASAAAVLAPAADPTSVTIAGSLDPQLGCANQWDPACAAAHLDYSAASDVWSKAWPIPAGNYEYKAALNDSWTESYGLNTGGANIPLALAADTTVKFYYDNKTHWVTDNHNSVIATVPGDFQSLLGCSVDWAPDCLRTWLEDPTGSGTYSFQTHALPAGSYQAKVAINESWNENYGAGGVANGPNINFTVPNTGALVTFRYNPTTHILNISAGHSHDNNVEFFGLGHNSQDMLYRTPFGALSLGQTLTLRFRTYHNDVTGVRTRFYDTANSREFFQDMTLTAANVSCYDPAQPGETCDFWETSYKPAQLTTLYYRFVVTDGTATAFYADDANADGGWGVATPTMVDNSYAVTVYDPAFKPIPWMQNAVVYQIFPDRFRNDNFLNDPKPGEPRYGYPPSATDQILNKPWSALPEGYCRSYSNPATPCTETPLGRDFFGGDLKGVMDKLDYLQSLGVTAIYFNPIFEAASDHLYDGRDYKQVSHWFGTEQDWNNLVAAADQRGIRLLLDGVFNHVSSDSKYFDRYGHFATVGACESLNSPYRAWFTFHDVAAGAGTCAGAAGPKSATYDAWFGFDSLPVLNKNNPQVQALVYAGQDNVAAHWLNLGSSGWRLDVMNDGSFPPGFWQSFRATVKGAKSDAPVIGELWKKGDVLPMIHGDQADTTMNYRFRNAIQGFFGTVDNKGFPDDNQSNEAPSLFAGKLMSIREDYPDATYYTLLNLMDSHDTERILWSLTPGQKNREDKEFNAANLAQGKQMLQLATVVQMTVPGAPTIYYGDEVGMTGGDDPDDRRPFPWTDIVTPTRYSLYFPWMPANGGRSPSQPTAAPTAQPAPAAAPNANTYGAGGDAALLSHYRMLTKLRSQHPVFRDGRLSFLMTDDTHRTLAYLLRNANDAAIVAINRNPVAQTLTIPATGQIPDAAQMIDALGNVGTVTASGGVLTFDLAPLTAAVLLPAGNQDLLALPAPTNLQAHAGNGQVELTWTGVPGAAAYRIYRSFVSGGGYQVLGTTPTAATSFVDTAATNGTRYHYVARAVDPAGIVSPESNEAAATPAFPIGYAVLQWPKAITETLKVTPTETIYGQVWAPGLTDSPTGDPGAMHAQVGFGVRGSDPAAWTTWQDMSFNVRAGNNFEYMGRLRPEQTGTFDMLVRFSDDGGLTWVYGDQNGIGTAMPGVLTVLPNPNGTIPAPPVLQLADWSANYISLKWDPVPGAAEYWVYRHEPGGTFGPRLSIVVAPTAMFTDTAVATGITYTYAVKAVSPALVQSALSNQVSHVAQLKLVNVTFRVKVPANTPPGDIVYLPNAIDPLGSWNPGIRPMTKSTTDPTVWETTWQILDGTALEYKYARGSWDRVEWWGTITSTANRHVTISYGTTGNQLVDNTATDWGNGPDETKAVQNWRDPLVDQTTPAKGATVPAPANVTVVFARNIQPAGADFSTSIVVKQGATTVAGTVAPAATPGNTLVWTPTAALAAGTYDVTVFNVKSDLSGDSVLMQAPYTFSFTVQ